MTQKNYYYATRENLKIKNVPKFCDLSKLIKHKAHLALFNVYTYPL